MAWEDAVSVLGQERGLGAEVVVVGGGPAGAATAAHLARAGRDVLLLEGAAAPREKPCGEYYGPGVVDALGRLGALEAVTARPTARPPGMVLSADGKTHTLSYPAEGRAGGARREALGVARLELDGALVEHARASGARVVGGARVGGALVEDGRVVGVRLRRSPGSGREERVRAGVVVGADGRNSAVARSLGLARPVRWPARLGLHAHYRVPEEWEGRPGEMHVAGRDLYCGLAPVGGGLVSVGLVAGMGTKPAGSSPTAFFDRAIRERLPGVADALAGGERVSRVRGVGPLSRRVSRVSGPGYLLVGDAAGFRDPFTGEGVFRALRGAELAAQGALEALARADGAPRDYGEARRRAFADKERLVRVIQALVPRPTLLGYALDRLSKRPGAAAVVEAALGDYRPAAAALEPGPLWALLKP